MPGQKKWRHFSCQSGSQSLANLACKVRQSFFVPAFTHSPERRLERLGRAIGIWIGIVSISEEMVRDVLDPDKGVCADPADGGAILGRGEPDPHSENRERQLAPDKGRGKT